MGYAVMWSGGKDCALALWRAGQLGLTVSRLLTVHDPASGRVRFHNTGPDLLRAQAEAIGIELELLPAAWTDMDSVLRTAFSRLRADGVEGIIFGDIHLADVRAWYEERVRAAGLEHLEPIWGQEPRALLEEFVRIGGRALVTCCELDRLDQSWLGRVTDRDFATEIVQAGVDPCGENGEYHSFAFAGPMFQRELAIEAGPTRVENGFALLELRLRPPTRS